jgi:hypothetical protein
LEKQEQKKPEALASGFLIKYPFLLSLACWAKIQRNCGVVHNPLSLRELFQTFAHFRPKLLKLATTSLSILINLINSFLALMAIPTIIIL